MWIQPKAPPGDPSAPQFRFDAALLGKLTVGIAVYLANLDCRSWQIGRDNDEHAPSVAEATHPAEAEPVTTANAG